MSSGVYQPTAQISVALTTAIAVRPWVLANAAGADTIFQRALSQCMVSVDRNPTAHISLGLITAAFDNLPANLPVSVIQFKYQRGEQSTFARCCTGIEIPPPEADALV